MKIFWTAGYNLFDHKKNEKISEEFESRTSWR